MHIVELKPLFYKDTACIGIYSPLSFTLNYHFQKKAGARWSNTHKCWYVTCTEKNYELLAKALKGIAQLEVTELKKYLLEKKKSSGKENLQLPIPVIPPKNLAPQKIVAQHLKQALVISKENNEALQKFTQQLILKSYSPSTIRTYTNEFMQFLQVIKDKPVNEFTVHRIKDYLQYCFEKLKLSENTLHSRINALKFYYE